MCGQGFAGARYIGVSRFSELFRPVRQIPEFSLSGLQQMKVNRTRSIDSGKFEKYISVAEAARIVGITTQAMFNLARKGRVTTRAVAGRILVLRSEAESFVPRPRGGQAKEIRTKMKSLKKPLEGIDKGNSGRYI